MGNSWDMVVVPIGGVVVGSVEVALVVREKVTVVVVVAVVMTSMAATMMVVL